MSLAIADASGDITQDWQAWIWLILATVALIVWVGYRIVTNPVPPLDPQETDTADPAPCARRGGHFYHMDPTRTFYQCADQDCGHRVNRSGGEL